MSTNTINVAGIDRAELLAALHNGTKVLGMGRFQALGRDITVSEAREALNNEGTPDYPMRRFKPGEFDFDYFYGKPLKVRVVGDLLYGAGRYDRDAPGGEGSCQKIIDSLRAKVN